MSHIGNAIEKRDQGPGAMVEQYQDSLAVVMPSHLQGRVAAWVRTTQGLLRRDPKLMEAAQNDVGQFLAVLMDAHRLGLEPGTEQYHLIPRWNRKKGCTEVTGVRGYQGEIELMYRAGAVSSVIVEVVYDADRFEYRPGRDERPLHDVDWDTEDRGELRLAYAYAVMKDGATSKVVVLNRGHIAKAKAKSDSASGKYPHLSPWVTDTEAMWLKTAARRLAKWVPTSAEYMRDHLQVAKEVAAALPPSLLNFPAPAPGTVDDDDPIEAELID
ncbi:recombinase RecT [Streptomyces virginiae]|uniref:recombinase RecT n=1 Tax=Streptomyces virginiae TaxID=1961 RepID=UPI002256255E|nr:recombinase RecT [Streptomyces virginiae]MCX5176766.1 recombinase RecT [Streptomyces virginiae]